MLLPILKLLQCSCSSVGTLVVLCQTHIFSKCPTSLQQGSKISMNFAPGMDFKDMKPTLEDKAARDYNRDYN